MPKHRDPPGADALAQYLQSARTYPRLDAGEEERCARALIALRRECWLIALGCAAARDQLLVEAHKHEWVPVDGAESPSVDAWMSLDPEIAMQETLGKLGERYHVSPERIRQLQQLALARLRHLIESGELPSTSSPGARRDTSLACAPPRHIPA